MLSIYWSLAPAALRGVLDQIRTALTLLVAELRANTPSDEVVPTAAAANQAVQVVVSGKRNTVSLNTAQSAAPESSARVTMPKAEDQRSPFWTRSRRIGAFIVGAATVIGAAAAVIAIAH